MKRSLFVVVLLAVVLTASLSAAAQLSVSGGVRSHSSTLDPYVYVEASLADNLDLGFEYYRSRLGLSLWSGVNRGFYGELFFASSALDRAEIGLWHEFDLSDRSLLIGWLGARRQLAGSQFTSVSLNAELQQRLDGSLYLVAGAGAAFGNNNTDVSGWVGLGFGY